MERKRGRKLMGEINVVPYIDVMLVLLIIFMVTAPMLSQGIKVDLPKAGAAPIEPDKLEPLLLSVDRDGRFYLNIGALTPALSPKAGEGVEGLTESRVLEIASAALRREPERPVLVKADRAVAYGRVVEGMVLLQKAGARKVGFVTDPAPSLDRQKGSR
jgi:biopolymer transport protein TolR